MHHTDDLGSGLHHSSIPDDTSDNSCGCGGGCGCHSESGSMTLDQAMHDHLMDIGLGFVRPLSYVRVKEGDTVVDLGSGMGIDSLMAREMTGPGGKVIGIDTSEKNISKARANVEMLGFNNVEFRQSPLHELTVGGKSANVVVSNMALVSVADRKKVFSETYRILKHHGHLCFADLVVKGDMPAALKADAELYMGCSGGMMTLDEYLRNMEEAGFEDICVNEEIKLELPDAMLHYYLPPEEAKHFRDEGPGVYTVAVSAAKPCCHAGEEDHVCCGNH